MDKSQELEFNAKLEFLLKSNMFLHTILLTAAARNAEMGLEDGGGREISRRILVASIRKGLQLGIFRPVGELVGTAGFSEEEEDDIEMTWDEKIPWSIVVSTAAEHEVDADQVREDFADELRQQLASAEGMVEGGESSFMLKTGEFANLEEVATDMAERIARRLGGEADVYLLHCVHDDHSCAHPYSSLEEAVDGAVSEIFHGSLQEVNEISHQDKVIMDEESLNALVKGRVELMHAARNN